MAIRIDEYGHIIRDDTTTSVNATSSTQNSDVNLTNVSDDLSLIRVDSAQTNSQTSTPILETSIPWYGRGGVFWTVTIILSIAIALVRAFGFYFLSKENRKRIEQKSYKLQKTKIV